MEKKNGKRSFFNQGRLRQIKTRIWRTQFDRSQRNGGKIKIAREFGDLSENAEYDAAKEEQGFLEKRIREINEMLSNCTIIDESTIDTKTVSVGCIVKLQDLEFGDKLEYKIVGVSEAKIEENLISNESPLGSALIGKKKGQEVVVTTPGGEARFKILSINA